jgi:sugar/nucleoside kinase (ribokinase family)
MEHRILHFGEILWDCLPSDGMLAARRSTSPLTSCNWAPPASLISAVGQDPLGATILKVAEDKGVNTQFVTRARIGLPTELCW